ncbi:Hpt domain-containing protein [Thermosyntropha lipolytica DSM 11003]|uniref:Circadian input-output histidine kinase CikA n=1 Tax=Thermosyntropha lipolytica DSM 11003 TaxID=1123382 RepID=A0A1M5M602_9FIRM|nr:response regulator [Thermosyntropha lipolytica]SHG72650.1 Hpt domain-containing protein [Thermosyntropha lipolytica DSM 11003]
MSKKVSYHFYAYGILFFILSGIIFSILINKYSLAYYEDFIKIAEMIVIITAIYLLLLLILHILFFTLKLSPNNFYIKLKTRFMPIRYQAHILENVQESIVAIALTPNNDIFYMNEQAKKLYGDLRKGNLELLSTKLSLSPEEIEEIKKHIKSGQAYKIQKTLTVEGEKKLFLHKITPLHNHYYLEGLLIISSDITELVKQKIEAETANISKSLFLANMSHEIRTPLIGILGAVDLLEKSDLNPKQLENTSIIRRCSEEVLDIITQILDVSKIEIGLLKVVPQPCDLYEVFQNLITIIEPLIREKSLKLEVNLDFTPWAQVLVDPIKLRQILSQILFNAVKFTHKGKVTIKGKTICQDNNAFLCVDIADTGIGIPENELKNIFDPFTQVDNSASRSYGGTGIGLYICHKLVQAMEGTIDIKSRIGQGTTVSLKIPLMITDNSGKVQETNNKPTRNDIYQHVIDNQIVFFPRSVLLVEDNKLNQKIIAEILINYGFEVATADNGLECLSMLQKSYFDIILMDMQMPVMDGYEATRLIRQDEKLKDIPIIAITAHAVTGDKEKCLACGCSSYLAKPFKAEELIEEIKKYLSRQVKPVKISPLTPNLFIKEFIPEFLDTLGNMLEELDIIIANRDIDNICSISHDIKGMAGMYGFHEISETAAQMEKAAKLGAWETIHIMQQKLYALYQNAESQVS